ncbi:MAG: hypothetical protein PVS2B2_20140 [Candidatus Acidiferrum sp.]
MTPSRTFFALLFLFIFIARPSSLRAQSPGPQPSPDQASAPVDPQQPTAPEKPDAPIPKTSSAAANEPIYKRILGIIPNFIATEDTPENRRPLTPRQKYNLAFHQMFDYSAHLGIGIGAAIDQASEGESNFGQGWGAYGERFGAAEAGNITGSFLTTGFFPHIFKQDPRFFRRGTGGIKSRAWYAFTRTVITRSDEGKSVFNSSSVLGSLVGDSVSTAFYPETDHSVAQTFTGWGLQIAQNGGFNILSEFYPDIVNKVLRRNRKAPQYDPLPTPPESPAQPPGGWARD